MRDLVLTIFVFGSLPWILSKPYIGILIWSWLGYMNPHRLAWSYAYDFPYAQVVAIATLISLLLTKESKRIPITALTILWVIFILWMTITTLFAIYPDHAFEQYIKVIKIQLITFITLMVMGSKDRINLLIWIIVLSIGFYGVKGGLFTVIQGGDYRVWGPGGSFITDNNSLALALLMILPLMRYLHSMAENIFIRWGLVGGMILCGFAIVGSYSRGAFLAGFSMIFFLWLKSKGKLITGAILIFMIPVLIMFMPEQWHERMSTIQNYQEDRSAMGRLNAWSYSINIASNRLTGGGFESWSTSTFAIYAPRPDVHAAHSIYFGVLGDHGWVGLALFIVVLMLTWRTGRWIIRHAENYHELLWVSNLTKMVQVSLIAFFTGGAFLSLAYFDLFWHLLAIIVLVKALVQKHIEQYSNSKLKQHDLSFKVDSSPYINRPRLGDTD